MDANDVKSEGLGNDHANSLVSTVWCRDEVRPEKARTLQSMMRTKTKTRVKILGNMFNENMANQLIGKVEGTLVLGNKKIMRTSPEQNSDRFLPLSINWWLWLVVPSLQQVWQKWPRLDGNQVRSKKVWCHRAYGWYGDVCLELLISLFQRQIKVLTSSFGVFSSWHGVNEWVMWWQKQWHGPSVFEFSLFFSERTPRK